jgi:hypothetical protein
LSASKTHGSAALDHGPSSYGQEGIGVCPSHALLLRQTIYKDLLCLATKDSSDRVLAVHAGCTRFWVFMERSDGVSELEGMARAQVGWQNRLHLNARYQWCTYKVNRNKTSARLQGDCLYNPTTAASLPGCPPPSWSVGKDKSSAVPHTKRLTLTVSRTPTPLETRRQLAFLPTRARNEPLVGVSEQRP